MKRKASRSLEKESRSLEKESRSTEKDGKKEKKARTSVTPEESLKLCIGEYRVVKQLGHGSFGAVFRAERKDEKTDQVDAFAVKYTFEGWKIGNAGWVGKTVPSAIQTLRARKRITETDFKAVGSYFPSDDELSEFLKEWDMSRRAYAAGCGPRVVEAFMCPGEGATYNGILILELFSGSLSHIFLDYDSLYRKALVAKPKARKATLLGRLRDVVDQLKRLFLRRFAAMEKAGLVHGDLFPRNILVRPTGDSKLFDESDKWSISDLVFGDWGNALEVKDVDLTLLTAPEHWNIVIQEAIEMENLSWDSFAEWRMEVEDPLVPLDRRALDQLVPSMDIASQLFGGAYVFPAQATQRTNVQTWQVMDSETKEAQTVQLWWIPCPPAQCVEVRSLEDARKQIKRFSPRARGLIESPKHLPENELKFAPKVRRVISVRMGGRQKGQSVTFADETKEIKDVSMDLKDVKEVKLPPGIVLAIVSDRISYGLPEYLSQLERSTSIVQRRCLTMLADLVLRLLSDVSTNRLEYVRWQDLMIQVDQKTENEPKNIVLMDWTTAVYEVKQDENTAMIQATFVWMRIVQQLAKYKFGPVIDRFGVQDAKQFRGLVSGDVKEDVRMKTGDPIRSQRPSVLALQSLVDSSAVVTLTDDSGDRVIIRPTADTLVFEFHVSRHRNELDLLARELSSLLSRSIDGL